MVGLIVIPCPIESHHEPAREALSRNLPGHSFIRVNTLSTHVRGENVPRCSLKIRQRLWSPGLKKKNHGVTQFHVVQEHSLTNLRDLTFTVSCFTSNKLHHSCTGIIWRLRHNRTLRSNQRSWIGTGWNSRSNLDSIKQSCVRPEPHGKS